MNKKEFFGGMQAAVPVCLGLIPVGISYGLLAVQAGLNRFQTVLMSAAVMAGSSQLMAVSMIGQAAIISIVVAVFFVNLRHIVMSSSVMSRLDRTSLSTKLLCAFALCDESFALFSLSEGGSSSKLLGANTAMYIAWVLSSFAGCVLGQILPEVVSRSFGVAVYAAFLAMLAPNMVSNKGIFWLVVLAAVMNTLLQLLLPSSWAVIIAMILSAGIGTFFVEVPSDEKQ